MSSVTNLDTDLIIDFRNAPSDAIERLIWLGGCRDQFDSMMDAQWRHTYYQARLTGRLDAALALGLHSNKRALSWTRAENERRGRLTHWGDGRR